MENKAQIIQGILVLLIIGVLFLGIFYLLGGFTDLKQYREYKSFCQERQDFCYCEWGECEFMTQTSYSTNYVNGNLINNSSSMSEDTIELCKLAKSLDDKEILFRTGCEI